MQVILVYKPTYNWGGPSCTVVKQFLWFRTHKFFTKSQHPAISEDNLELARLYTKIGAWHRDVFEASILGFVVRGWGDLRSAREWYVLCVFFLGGVGGKNVFQSIASLAFGFLAWLLSSSFCRFLLARFLVSPDFCGSSLRVMGIWLDVCCLVTTCCNGCAEQGRSYVEDSRFRR